MAALPRNVLPRSPAGLLAGEDSIARSPSALSALSTASASPMNHPGLLRRRSTETSNSGGLDYYWSNLAGVGPGSSSSSLAISPSPSHALLSTSPAHQHPSASTSSIPTPAPAPAGGSGAVAPGQMRSRSQVDLRDGRKDWLNASTPPIPSPRSAPDHGHHTRVAGSVPALPVLDIPPNVLGEMEMESPGGWSESSDYSNSERETSASRGRAFANSINGRTLDSTTSSSGHSNAQSHSAVDYRALVDDAGESKRPLMDEASASTQSSIDDWQVRGSIGSSSTYRPQDRDDIEMEKTPLAPIYQDRTELNPPGLINFDRTQYPSPSRPTAVITSKQTTPTRPTASPSASGYTPGSGRLPFNAPLEIFRTSPNDPRLDVHITSPQSAPAWQSEFAELDKDNDESAQETIKGRNRRTLPANTSVESVSNMENEMLSPVKYAVTPEKAKGRDLSPSPGRSPEPPPRSTLRAPYVPSHDTSPRPITPNPPSKDLPTIINTTHSPVTLSSSEHDPPRPSRSPSRTPSISNSATINDLTDMLGGAIDAIGLMDSRDTPPPTVMEPKKDRPSLSLNSLAPAAELNDNGPITPGSLPSRGMSLIMPPPPVPEVKRAPSSLSLSTTHALSPSATQNIATRPWPAAMLYSNIKGMKYAGDRAKAYARAINDLAKAETGLKEWCAASVSSQTRPTLKPHPSIGARSSSYSSSTLAIPVAHARTVSSSSEFPMRADSYTAREISQRVIDPSDAPSSLPPNLPYPHLQQQLQQTGMKSSQSMQSVSSFASGKRGFFGGIGKKSSKQSTSLGPPSSVNKKDVRGLPISGPSYPARSTSPQKLSDVASRQISAPMGPRGPRMGSFTPPPVTSTANMGYERSSTEIPTRASLDTGLTRLNAVPPPRNSLDSGTGLGFAGSGRKSSLPPRSSPMSSNPGLVGGAGGTNVSPRSSPSVSEGEVNMMGDILPHVNKSVLRAYLGRYGDQMQAIGMYLEDEKRGSIMRV